MLGKDARPLGGKLSFVIQHMQHYTQHDMQHASPQSHHKQGRRGTWGVRGSSAAYHAATKGSRCWIMKLPQQNSLINSIYQVPRNSIFEKPSPNIRYTMKYEAFVMRSPRIATRTALAAKKGYSLAKMQRTQNNQSREIIFRKGAPSRG